MIFSRGILPSYPLRSFSSFIKTNTPTPPKSSNIYAPSNHIPINPPKSPRNQATNKMQSNIRILLLAFAALFFVNMAQAGNLIVKNMCSFSVYCYSSSAANPATVPASAPYLEVKAGTSLTGAYPGNDVCILKLGTWNQWPSSPSPIDTTYTKQRILRVDVYPVEWKEWFRKLHRRNIQQAKHSANLIMITRTTLASTSTVASTPMSPTATSSSWSLLSTMESPMETFLLSMETPSSPGSVPSTTRARTAPVLSVLLAPPAATGPSH